MLTGTIWDGFSNVREWIPERAEELNSAKTRHLLAWWIGEAGGATPSRRRFDILQHGAIVHNIFLIEVGEDGNFRTRIVGDEASWWVEADRERKVITPDDPIDNNRRLYRYYRYIAENRVPVAMTGSVRFIHTHRREGTFEGVDCPLLGDDGRVAAIIGVLDLV